MSGGNEMQLDETAQAADIVQWDATSHSDRSLGTGRRDRSIGLAVAGITIAALLVGGLVAYVISLS